MFLSPTLEEEFKKFHCVWSLVSICSSVLQNGFSVITARHFPLILHNFSSLSVQVSVHTDCLSFPSSFSVILGPPPPLPLCVKLIIWLNCWCCLEVVYLRAPSWNNMTWCSHNALAVVVDMQSFWSYGTKQTMVETAGGLYLLAAPQQLKGHATTLCRSFLSLAQWSARIWTVVKKSIYQREKTLMNNDNSCNGLYKNVCRVSGMRAADLTNIGAKFFKINDCGPTKGSVTLKWLLYRYAHILYDQWPKHPTTAIPLTSSNPPRNSLRVVRSWTSPNLSQTG